MGAQTQSTEGKPDSRDASAPQSRRIAIAVKPQQAAEHPRGQELVRIWTEARDAGQPMARGDVPSRKLLKLMPHLFLLEPNADGTDWRFRLAGTAIARRFCADPTGALISQIYERRQHNDQAAIYKRVVTSGAPHITRAASKASTPSSSSSSSATCRSCRRAVASIGYWAAFSGSTSPETVARAHRYARIAR